MSASLDANIKNMKNSLAVALVQLEPQIDEICAKHGLEFSGRETLAWVTSSEGIRYRVSVLVESAEVAEAYND